MFTILYHVTCKHFSIDSDIIKIDVFIIITDVYTYSQNKNQELYIYDIIGQLTDSRPRNLISSV